MALKLSLDAVDNLLKASQHDASNVLPSLGALMATVTSCLSELPSSSEANKAPTCQLLLHALRVLRNLCAGGGAACEEVLRRGTVAVIRRLLELVESGAIQLDWQLPLVSAQLLANASTASASCAAAVWEGSFPQQLNALAHVNSGPAQSALALCLLSCSRKAPGAAAALCSPAGAPTIAAALNTQHRLHQEGKCNDNLGLLLSYLCLHRDLLPPLCASLAADPGPPATPNDPNAADGCAANGSAAVAAIASPPEAAAAVAAHPSRAHVALLQELCSEAQAEGHLAFEGETPQERGGGGGGEGSMRFLVDLVGELGRTAKRGPLSEGQQQVMQDTLQLMRDIAGSDDPPAGALSQRPSLVSALQLAGMLPLLLAMVKALGPIRSPQHPQQAQHAGQGGGSSGSGRPDEAPQEGLAVAELAPALAQQAQQLPSQPPYHGYRADLLSVLANAAYGRSAVKAEVQALGGVELVLSQCQMDRQSPLAREWALWGVRNLCEGNEAAQAAIRELQLCTAVETEEARQLGVKLEFDKGTGKLKVVQQQQQQEQRRQSGAAAPLQQQQEPQQ